MMTTLSSLESCQIQLTKQHQHHPSRSESVVNKNSNSNNKPPPILIGSPINKNHKQQQQREQKQKHSLRLLHTNSWFGRGSATTSPLLFSSALNAPTVGNISATNTGSSSSGTSISRSWCREIQINATEPPLDNNVPERPCTLVLAEDFLSIVSLSTSNSTTSSSSTSTLASSSWNEHFRVSFPIKYGIPYAYWTMSDNIQTFSDAIMEMKNDLSPLTEIVFIARGPWISWMAQFYLEDLPFTGLVLIDPLPFDQSQDAVRLYEKIIKAQCPTSAVTSIPNENESQLLNQQRALFHDYMNHWDHWSLRLEAGAVPILVITTKGSMLSDETKRKELWFEMAEQVAKRNSDVENQFSRFGNVPVHAITADDTIAVERIIHQWIHNVIL